MFWMIVYIYIAYNSYMYIRCVWIMGIKTLLHCICFNARMHPVWTAEQTITNLDGDQDAIIPWNQIPHLALAQQNNHTSVLETRAEWYKHFHP